MDSDTKTCKTCNHSCHCYGPECDNCSCDVCDCGSIKEYSSMGHNYSPEARKSFKARHAKNIAKGRMSAAYWANKELWSGPKGSKKSPPRSQKHTKGLNRK